jgi:predicted RNA binding protein YcfA (HicA-like mRNA interferase family)
VGNIPGVNHQQAIRAFARAGFWIVRQSGHVVMSNGSRIITIPRSNPINGYTLGGIVRDAGLSEDEFRKLL